MSGSAPSDTNDRPRVLVAHPGAELFGSDRMALESVAGLREAGADVVVALPSTGPLIAELRRAGAEVVVAPSFVLRKSILRPSSWPRLVRDVPRAIGAAWRLIGTVRPDAVYVSTVTLPLWPVIARLRRKPVITHVHEAEASSRRIVNGLIYAPHLLADRILINSEFSRHTLGSVYRSVLRRTTIVRNGVASPETVVPPREVPTPLRVLYVGRLSPRKGTDLVIEAASQLAHEGTPAEVTLLGDVFEGYEWYAEQLRAQAVDAACAVTFAGFHRDIWPFIAEADVVIVPSRVDEPFGNTAVEGILGERAVIVSDTSGLREAAAGYPTAWFVPVDNAGAIADRLRTIAREWPTIVASLSESRAEARRRHAPALYRSAVSNDVLSTARRGHPGADRRAVG